MFNYLLIKNVYEKAFTPQGFHESDGLPSTAAALDATTPALPKESGRRTPRGLLLRFSVDGAHCRE